MSSSAALRLIGVVAAMCCLLAACGKQTTRGLPGLWLADGTSTRSIEFRPDGTVQMRVRQAEEGPPAHWVVAETGQLKLTFGEGDRESSQSMSYELKGDDELTLKRASAGANPNAVAHYRRVAFDDLKKYTPLPPQDWVYEDKPSGGGTPERIASATSGEASDGSAVDLVLRRRASNDMVVELGTGSRRTRFSCIKTCEFGVRFDDEALAMFAIEPSADGNTSVVSFKDKDAVMTRLRKARRMQVQAKIANQGVVPYDFKVDGLQLQ